MPRWILIAIVFLAGAALKVVHAEDPSKAIAEARKFLKQGKSEEALKAADEAVKLDPNSALAWYIHGEANGQLRKPQKAIEDFDRVLKLDPKFDVAINQRGGERFKLADIQGSIDDFEKYIKLHPVAYDDHWRYGISLYYAGKFAEGAKQFKAGEKAFGNDVENAFFHYICNARVEGVEKARKNILVIGPDRRIPMMKIYDLIHGKAKPDEVIETAEKANLGAEDKNEALFYGHLYVGLNYDAEGNAKKAEEHLRTAVEKHQIGHYMWDVGNVHLKLLKK